MLKLALQNQECASSQPTGCTPVRDMLIFAAGQTRGGGSAPELVNNVVGRAQFGERHAPIIQDCCIASSWPTAKWNLQKIRSTFSIMAKPPELPEWDKSRVGERLVLLRQAKGLQQKQLAAMTGISPQQLNNYEKGRDLIPVPYAVRFCVVTGANFDYVYRGIMGTLPPELLQALAPKAAKRA